MRGGKQLPLSESPGMGWRGSRQLPTFSTTEVRLEEHTTRQVKRVPKIRHADNLGSFTFVQWKSSLGAANEVIDSLEVTLHHGFSGKDDSIN